MREKKAKQEKEKERRENALTKRRRLTLRYDNKQAA